MLRVTLTACLLLSISGSSIPNDFTVRLRLSTLETNFAIEMLIGQRYHWLEIESTPDWSLLPPYISQLCIVGSLPSSNSSRVYVSSSVLGDSRVGIHLSMGSVFGQAVGSMMFSPSGNETFSLILRPQDPLQYCVDRQMSFVTTHVDPGSRRVMVGSFFDLFDDDPEQSEDASPVPLVISLKDRGANWIPFHVLQRINTIITHHGGYIWASDNNSRYLMGEDCYNRFTSVLPTLRIRLANELNGSIVTTQILVYPEDYVVRPPIGVTTRCRFLLSSPPMHEVPRLDINLIRHLGVLFEYERNLYGFCDPI